MSDAKMLRKQIKNVLQEVGKELVTSEVGSAVEKNLLESMNARLDNIDKYCQQSLEKQDKRARAIQSFILQEVQVKIQNDIFNASCTVDAIVEVLAESGVVVEGFAAKVDAKKLEVAERRKQAAAKAMEESAEAKIAEAKAAQEAAAAPAEQPQVAEAPQS